jgi:hypothetical protein
MIFWRINNMKETKENQKGKGWNEDADPTCINKRGKPVARRHHQVAVKEELKNTLRTPLSAPLRYKGREDDELTEEIIEEVQKKRTEPDIAKDKSKTAKNLGNREDPEDLVEWIKEPGESDLEAIETKSSKPDKEAEEE